MKRTTTFILAALALFALVAAACSNPAGPSGPPGDPAPQPRITSFTIEVESGVTSGVDVDDTDQIILVVNGSPEAIDPATVSFSASNGSTVGTDGAVTFNYYGTVTLSAEITDDDGSVKTATVDITVDFEHDLLFVGTSYLVDTDLNGTDEWEIYMINTKTNNLFVAEVGNPSNTKIGSWKTAGGSLWIDLPDFSINNDAVGYSYMYSDIDSDGTPETVWQMVGIDNADFEYWKWR
jgi:hypothetical protein